jgi:hypothetical protein
MTIMSLGCEFLNRITISVLLFNNLQIQISECAVIAYFSSFPITFTTLVNCLDKRTIFVLTKTCCLART